MPMPNLLAFARSGGADGSELSRALARLRLTVAGGMVVLVAVLGWVAANRAGSLTIYLLAYAVLVVLGLSWLIARRRLALQVDRSQLPLRSRAGQVLDVELTITSRRRVSTIVVEERLHPVLGRTVRVPISTLRPGEELKHAYALKPSLRGVYEIGPTTATWSDPFGLTTRSQQIAPAMEMIVHPAVEPVQDRVLTRMWEDPPVRPPISKPWPVGFEFYGMRDYVPGDDLRRVVWSVLAKTGKMMVRESEQGITDRVILFVDNDRAWHSPGQPSLTFETAIRAAASLGVKHLADGFSLSVLTGDGMLLTEIRGSRSRVTLLDALARISLGDSSIANVGPQLMAAARSGAHFVVITPHLAPESASQLRLVLQRGSSVVVAKVVWDETDPMSAERAAALGCQVVRIDADAPLSAVFAHQVGAGARR